VIKNVKIFFVEILLLHLGSNPNSAVMQIYSTCPKSDNFRKNEILKKIILILNKLLTCKCLSGVWMLLILFALSNQAIAATKTSITAGRWQDTGTWGGAVPGVSDNVVLNHKVTVDADFTCSSVNVNASGRLSIQPGIKLTVSGAITFASGGKLELFSDVDGSGSVIFGSIVNSAYANIDFERYMSGTVGTVRQWHTISAPMNSSSLSAFFSNVGSGNYYDIETNTAQTLFAFGRYLEVSNRWDYSPYVYDSDPNNVSIGGSFAAGKGYCVARKSDGSVKMSGLLVGPSLPIPIARTSTGTEPVGGFGWNALGNPYTASLNVSSFLTANSSQLDPVYGGLYVWNPVTGSYVVTTHASIILNTSNPPATYTPSAGDAYIQVGQGFVVRSKTGGGSVTFNYAMREHNSALAFKAASLSWPVIQLKTMANNIERTTAVAFNSAMSLGLDPYYDAGLLRSGGGMELYTRMVEDNGVDFAIQCLPDVGLNKMVIPVSLDFAAGGEVTFSAKSANLPAECQIVLEDRLTGTSTQLSAEGAIYKVTLPANTAGINRFYLHLNGISSVKENTDVPGFKVYAVDREIHIRGAITGQSVANLYDLSGRRVGTYQLQASDNNTLRPEGVANGIYLLRIMQGNKPMFVGKIRLQ
jgi:trimeric autotransporter adhesin